MLVTARPDGMSPDEPKHEVHEILHHLVHRYDTVCKGEECDDTCEAVVSSQMGLKEWLYELDAGKTGLNNLHKIPYLQVHVYAQLMELAEAMHLFQRIWRRTTKTRGDPSVFPKGVTLGKMNSLIHDPMDRLNGAAQIINSLNFFGAHQPLASGLSHGPSERENPDREEYRSYLSSLGEGSIPVSVIVGVGSEFTSFSGSIGSDRQPGTFDVDCNPDKLGLGTNERMVGVRYALAKLDSSLGKVELEDLPSKKVHEEEHMEWETMEIEENRLKGALNAGTGFGEQPSSRTPTPENFECRL
ncbi:hypothetical protein H2200_011365 [Cladophialophora chaetospira]|uniref:Uncharacterized protein n=1 Tax=Cladophialophora chaetospira TaxID=386627 RepID=A0AA39CD29_9EURO|nr:hypothetical protein H2200_011365 [Cladophialophora chaetospira]